MLRDFVISEGNLHYEGDLFEVGRDIFLLCI